MDSEQLWSTLRERCRSLDPADVLVTPTAERPFVVRSVAEDRLVVSFLDRETERPLWRDQFAVLVDQLSGDRGVALSALPSGVEPYVAVLSLHPGYEVADGRLRPVVGADPDGDADVDAGTDSPFLRPGWAVRRPAERVRDDAVLLADLLGRYDLSAPESLPVDALVDAYVLLSDTQRGAGRLRRQVGERLLAEIGPDGRLHGRFGTVARTERGRRRLKTEATVLAALDAAAVPREWVLGVDREKLDVVLAATELEESAVYDVDRQTYVRKAEVEEAEKQACLQGLRDRLAGLDSEGADRLRDEIADLEDRIEALLAAG